MPKEIVAEKGLAQITDTSEIEAIVLQDCGGEPRSRTGLSRRHQESHRVPRGAGDARHSRKGQIHNW